MTSGHLDSFYSVAGLDLVRGMESLEMFVEEVGGGSEGDDEPAKHN